MTARYDRYLNERVLPALQPGGAYRFLVSSVPVDDPWSLDIQLRERNKLMFYHGTTRLLVVQLRYGSGGVDARAHAAAAYGEYPGCQEQYHALMKWWRPGEVDAFHAAFLDYLPRAIAAANDRYYRNEKEGLWQNRMCVRYGRQWTSDDEWLIIDRECVLGFRNSDEKTRFYDAKRRTYQGIKNVLQNRDPVEWGKSDDSSFGDELDMLAISRTGELAAIELKHGSNASGVYWGPLQVGMYCDAFETMIASIRNSIRDLVRQKVALGLLPLAAKTFVDTAGLERVAPVLAIADPKERSKCWSKIELVMGEMGKASIPQPSSPLRLARVREKDGDLAVEVTTAVRPV